MALNHGPKLVTDGLVLWMDAADRTSYPGSGTTWTDLTRNGYNGTLTNGPTFSSANGGAIVLDGTDDYVQNSFSLDPNLGGFTYEAVLTSATANTSYPGWRVPIGIGGGSNIYGILVEADNRGYRLDVPNTSGTRIGVTTGINIAANTNTHIVWSWISGVFKLYLNGVLQRITLVGALFLGLVAVLPYLAGMIFGGGALNDYNTLVISSTGLLIVVGVVLDTMKQIEAQLMMRNYEGFIR